MQTITGKFPVPPYLTYNPSVNMTIWKKAGASYTFEQTQDLKGFGVFESYMENVRNSWAASAPWDVSVTGLPSPRIAPRKLYGPVIKVNNRPFLKRSKRGEMVVSDYNRMYAEISYFNGGSEVLIGSPQSQSERLDYSVAPYHWKPVTWNNDISKYALAPPGSNDIGMGSYFSYHNVRGLLRHYRVKSQSDDKTPYDVGWKDSKVQDFLDSKINVPRMVGGPEFLELVTATTAEANSRTVDILTALAEMPETIASIKSGVLQLIKMYKDARKGHFRIQNKAKRAQRIHEAKVYRINYESRQLYVAARNDRTRRIIENNRQRELAGARKDLALLMADFADAISSVWLTFRYGIMPNVYLIEDMVKSMSEGQEKFIRFSQKRELVIPTFDLEGWTKSGDLTATVRCFIKRSFKDTEVHNAPYSWNFAVSLWELFPLSFVIDWIINVGDLISALTGSTNQYKEAATVSVVTHSSNVTYTHDESKAKVNVQYSGYTRTVITPQSYCALVFDPFLDVQRKLDAASLSYQILIKSALKSLIKG